jgi:hypothetical protein
VVKLERLLNERGLMIEKVHNRVVTSGTVIGSVAETCTYTGEGTGNATLIVTAERGAEQPPRRLRDSPTGIQIQGTDSMLTERP